MKHWQQILENQEKQHSIDWLWELQQRKAQDFLAQGFPDKQEENWRHTDVSGISNQTFVSVHPNHDITGLDHVINKNAIPDCYLIVFVNGEIVPAYSSSKLLEVGVASTLKKQMTLDGTVHEIFSQSNNNSFSNLNLALLNNGVYINITKDFKIDKPIQLLFVAIPSDKPCMQHIHNIINIGENVSVKIIETYSSESSVQYWNNIVTKLKVEQYANVEYYKIQNESFVSHHLAQLICQQEKNSIVKTFNFSLGAKWSRENIDIELIKSNANISMHGLYCIFPEQFVDFHTCINHVAVNTTSFEKFKGILFKKAKGVFNGKIKVQPGAQKTIAKLINQNLLLEKTAEVNAKPELEIYADDVQCSHGATVGQLDEAALFYCQSRGIEYQNAINMLTLAFVQDMFDSIENKNIGKFIQDLVSEKLLCMF